MEYANVNVHVYIYKHSVGMQARLALLSPNVGRFSPRLKHKMRDLSKCHGFSPLTGFLVLLADYRQVHQRCPMFVEL